MGTNYACDLEDYVVSDVRIIENKDARSERKLGNVVCLHGHTEQV